MPLTTKLDRNLRAAEVDSDDESYYEITDRSSPSIIETGDGAEIVGSDSEEAGADTGSNNEHDLVRIMAYSQDWSSRS